MTCPRFSSTRAVALGRGHRLEDPATVELEKFGFGVEIVERAFGR
jgi:hypothetical protein